MGFPGYLEDPPEVERMKVIDSSDDLVTIGRIDPY
jgi:hypothetical protein